MPAGKVHLRIELGLFFVLMICGGIFVEQGMLSLRVVGAFLGAYLFSSLFLSPDLDLWESRATRRWGIGRILWYPYSKLFHHRRVSHHLIFGPLTRIIYLGTFVVLGGWSWSWVTGRSMRPPKVAGIVIISVILGLYLPNQIHIVVDRAWSRIRRWKRRR